MAEPSKLSFSFLLKYALKNLRRHPRRTILTGCAAAISAAILCFMFSYFNGIIDSLLASYARFQSGHLRLVHEDYINKQTLLPLDIHIKNADSLQIIIAQRKEVDAVTQRIRFGTLASSGSHSVPAIGMGIDFETENDFLDPISCLQAGSLPQSSEEIVVGHLLAKRLGLTIGDTLLLLGQDSRRSLAAGEFLISGLISLGMNPVDRRSVYLPLESAREFTDLPGATNEILVLLKNEEEDQKVKEFLINDLNASERHIDIIAWREQGDLSRALASSKTAIKIFILYFFAIAASTIINTILMAVLERGREIGMLRALGMSQWAIRTLFILEGGFIGMLFAPLGAAFGALVAGYTERVGIPIGEVGQSISIPFGNVIYPDFRWEYLLQAVIFTFIMSLIASLYPAWKAGRVNMATVLRTHG